MFKKLKNEIVDAIISKLSESATVTKNDLNTVSNETAEQVKKDIVSAVDDIRQTIYSTAQTTRKLVKREVSSLSSPAEEATETSEPQEPQSDEIKIKPNTFGLEELAFANFLYKYVEDGGINIAKTVTVTVDSQQFVENFKLYLAKHSYYPGLTPRSFNCVLLKVLRSFEITPNANLRDKDLALDGENLDKFVNKWRTIKKKAWGM